VIWYQGEKNVNRAEQYRRLFPALIKDWRTGWGQGDFPFYYVQIAPLGIKGKTAVAAELREAQLMSMGVKNVGMAVTIDIGEPNIHPRNKQDVGRRLALWALAKTYGKKLEYCGPIYKSMKTKGDKITLCFDYVDGGLVSKDGEKLKGFTIAGADRKFFAANAKIDGDSVVVWSRNVAEPVAVRYGWANNPVCNLYNRGGLPASPFRTDDWPRSEVDEK
jgi:sialate O-acetylesterase